MQVMENVSVISWATGKRVATELDERKCWCTQTWPKKRTLYTATEAK